MLTKRKYPYDNHIWMAFSTCVIQTNTVIFLIMWFCKKKLKRKMSILSTKFEDSRIIFILHSASEWNQHVCQLLHKSWLTNFLYVLMVFHMMCHWQSAFAQILKIIRTYFLIQAHTLGFIIQNSFYNCN